MLNKPLLKEIAPVTSHFVWSHLRDAQPSHSAASERSSVLGYELPRLGQRLPALIAAQPEFWD